MPTGYTAPVQDGTITEFADYALLCTRGFAPMVMLRDGDMSLEATKKAVREGSYLDGSIYHLEALAAAKERLETFTAMGDEEALAVAQAAHDVVVARNREMEQTRLAELARYQVMLAQVEAWEPPTEDHAEFKQFMAEQLRGSIAFDCQPSADPIPEVSIEWRDRKIAKTKIAIAHHEEEIAKQRERNERRKAWIEALLDSLETVPA